ncbi:MAG TPA: NAD(P)/FAD-dependent oxidoreductase [Nevskiaceae bacterium]|nr:NAD(P)/FAD-dependent oxidoreductase [Nevskiaceae bacterium]
MGRLDPPLEANPSVAIIGAGFGGLGMGYYLKKAGLDNFTIFEKKHGVGGTWRENTYPGAACDIASHLYSFSFEPHYPWSCRYGHQHEILAYQEHVAQKHGLARHIQFGREMAGATFDEARGLWTIRFTDGSTHEARVLVSAVGQLHRPQIPDLPGIDSFQGRAFHSARWDHDFDMKGRKVAVVGTGASAVQFVPEIAKDVEKLTVFQRTAGWCVPKFDRRYSRFERWLLTNVPFLHDLDRLRIFWWVEYLFTAWRKDSFLRPTSLAIGRTGAKLLMRLQVKDPKLREKLTPNFPLGCKRLLLSNDWLAALARPNVEVVTEAIASITPTGVKTADGREHAVDAIVYGTGFEATKFLAPMDLKGIGGASLQQQWAHGAQAYLGVGVSGFPNFYVLYGPNTNLGAGSIIFMLERQQRFVTKLVQKLKRESLAALDVKADAQKRYNDFLQSKNPDFVYEDGCNSWYLTEGRNTNNWLGYMWEYDRLLDKPRFEDFVAVPSRVAA